MLVELAQDQDVSMIKQFLVGDTMADDKKMGFTSTGRSLKAIRTFRETKDIVMKGEMSDGMRISLCALTIRVNCAVMMWRWM